MKYEKQLQELAAELITPERYAAKTVIEYIVDVSITHPMYGAAKVVSLPTWNKRA